jgi:hypothetical protein
VAVAAATGTVWAGDLSLYGLPQARVEYEGTGFRQVPNGWELKVKPHTPALGLRWRETFSPRLALQAQYWVNRTHANQEKGNTQAGPLTQTGQTRMFVNSLWLDLRVPLAGSRVEAVGGVNGLYESFRRKDIVFNLVPQEGTFLETHAALGVHVGFHAGSATPAPEEPGGRFFWDGEILFGNFLWTRNTLRADGGSIRRGGYSYLARGELGWARGPWRWTAGYTRHLYETLVPGGRTASGGAAVSLPINKTDFYGPFLGVGYAY